MIKEGDEDYISLTDMVKVADGDQILGNWIRNKNTLEFLGIWERLYNPEKFNELEFESIKMEAGTNRFTMSAKKWIELTNAIGLKFQAGRYGGVYAHRDIAFEFGTWISPEFKLLLIKEFQRLKEEEQHRLNSGWDIRRLVAKANYKIQTDAIAEKLIPAKGISKDNEWLTYAEEADLLNMAIFGCTAKQWRDANPTLASKGLNIRDVADVFQLIAVSNLESMNAELIRLGEAKEARFNTLLTIAQNQMKSLLKSNAMANLNAQSPYINAQMENTETIKPSAKPKKKK